MLKFVQVSLVMASLLLASAANASPLFEDDTVIDVELVGPVHELISNPKERIERPFTIRASGSDHDIKVRIRGKSRTRVCEFSPLRLGFETSDMSGSPFEGLGYVKLVTHCRNAESGGMNVLEEYIAYRIFGLLSNMAYRVRLLRMTYTDTGNKLDEDARNHYGFVIEPAQSFADRAAAVPLHVQGVRLSQLNRDQAALVYVFQYMIGNTDWSFVLADGDDTCCHNGDLFDLDGSTYYVPYDFDLSGIVNAAYAKPDPSFRMRSVRSRRYRGFCTDTPTLKKAIHTVNSAQPEVFELLDEIAGYSEKSAEAAKKYLQQFFDKAEDEAKLLRSFEKSCLD
jgi:hypothetical protein